MKIIDVSCNKSKIPIIWLDTSVIFKMIMWKRGDKLDKITSDRMKILYNTISELTKTKKLIYPFADQKEEIWRDRQECIELIFDISRGVKARYSEKIKDEQIFKFMKAYINNENVISIDYAEYFLEDPIKVINDNRNLKINVDLGLFEKPSEIKKRRAKQVVKLESIRQNNVKNGIKYDDQLELELNSEIKYLIESILNIDQLSSINLFGFVDALSQYTYQWEFMGGKDSEFIKFFYSDYCHNIPFIRVNSMLFAYIITGTDPIRKSHYMDINHASSAIPYVDFFLTDRNMKHIITKLDIDRQYNCQIFSETDTDDVIKILEDL